MEKHKICDFENRAYCIVSDVYCGQFFAEDFIPVYDRSELIDIYRKYLVD